MSFVDTSLKNDLKKFGVKNWNECFHCGNCTAICPLTEDNHRFPRHSIRLAQMGLKKRVSQNLDPWLCYYCGECTETCPRDANPGEVMMSLRRYLTSLYDWTGLSKLFYTKKIWEFIFILGIAAIVVLAFIFYLPPLDKELTAQGGVKINSFAPIKSIEYGDWLMAGIVAFLLISNIINMWYKTILSDRKTRVPFYRYITEAWRLILHFGTQASFSRCDKKSRGYWVSHLFLMTGYTLMFGIIVVFLSWFQTEEIHPITHPQRFLGYYATFGLLFGLTVVIIGRLKRSTVKFKFSHFSDWLFVIMLLLTTVSGILLHIFRIQGMPLATYYTYIFHLAVLIPMIMIEVPFSKWSHLAYRPFAIYFANLKKVAVERKVENGFAMADNN